MEEIEDKMKKLYRHIKSGRLTQEIAEEMSDLIDKVENASEEVKEKFSSMINDMKKAMKEMK